MPKRAKDLKAIEVQRLTAPGRHAVGTVPGLYLQVQAPNEATGSNRTARTWILRVIVGERRRDIGIGGYPAVTLAQAHERAREYRDLIAKGIDPIEQRKAAKSALRAARAAAVTFEQATSSYIKAKSAAWTNAKHAQQWDTTLRTYAFPVFGQMIVRDIALSHVLSVLEPIWTTKTETASRLRGRIESILDWATTRGYREGLNPARWKGHLDTILPAPGKVAKVEHHPAMPIDAVPEFVSALRTQEGTGARALELLVYTAARSGEIRGATWAEVDLDAEVWTVPADRMKAGREHRIPLSSSAVRLLKSLPQGEPDAYVFAATRGGKLSDMTLTAVMRRMKVEAAVPHGFRSTFRDWAAERTNYPHEAAELALAHAVGNKVEAAYRRGDMFAKRRQMMEDWAKCCTSPTPPKGQVIPLKKTRAGR